MPIIQAFQDSLQQVVDNLACGSIDPLTIMLAAAPPPPTALYEVPVLNRFLPPVGCTRPPRPPTPPFTGGQCYGTPYYVDLNGVNGDGETRVVQRVAFVGRLLGSSTYWRDFLPNFPEPYVGIKFYYQLNPTSPVDSQQFTFFNNPDPTYAGRTWLSNVRRQDGLPDTCGNPPGQLPPIAPDFPTIPTSFPPFNITIAPNVNVNFSGTFQINPAINIPIYGGIHIPITFRFNPNIFSPVAFNIPVYVRFPSLQINPDISFNAGVDITNEINFPGSGGGGGGGCECADIRALVREELDDKFPPGRPNSTQFESYAVAQSRLINLPQFSEWVQINLVDVPVNTKRQPGLDAPDVIYAGWYSFGINGEAGDRMPIHYEQQTVKVPQGATAFSYTVYTGFSATLSVRYREES